MIRWDELVMDLVAVVLIALGAGLIALPYGFIVGGVLVLVLSLGIKARRSGLTEDRRYKAREVDE